MIRQKLTSWSLHCSTEAEIFHIPDSQRVSEKMPLHSGIPRGAAQSFGDVSLPEDGAALRLVRENQKSDIQLDKKDGILKCSAAVTLGEVLRVVVPQGWVLPTVPGASQITVGGAIAADAHGKNHFHRGSIGDHLVEFVLLLASGDRISVDKVNNPEIFFATIGGLGLTGMILEAELVLQPVTSNRIRQISHGFTSISGMLGIIESQHARNEFLLGTVLGNFRPGHKWEGCVVTAQHAEKRLGESIPEYPQRKHPIVPAFISQIPMSEFSTWILRQMIRARIALFSNGEIDMDRFFFPQDALGSWNRLFGYRGLVDYQCCIPIASATDFFPRLHSLLNCYSMSCFLVALKRFRSSTNKNPLSFALDGVSVALDLPVRPGTFSHLDELDRLVVEYGGRVNLIKDARLSRSSFVEMYPQVSEWLAIKERLDPSGKFKSKLSTRLGLT